MGETKENFQSKSTSRAPARLVIGEIPLSWAEREIDIEAVRRWFIHRIAQEAIQELQQENRNGVRK